MAHTLRLKQIYRRNQSEISGTIGSSALSLAAEHQLALRAAEKATSPRKNLAELRAMYVSTPEPPPESGALEQTTLAR